MSKDGKPSNTGNHGKRFSWDVSLGGNPDDPAVQEALRTAAETGGSGRDAFRGSLEINDGVLRIGGGDDPGLEWDIGAHSVQQSPVEPFPILNTIRVWLNRTVTAIGIALPIALIGLGIATGQSAETVVFMAIFGIILSMMLVSSFSPPKTVLSSVLESYLKDTVRKHYEGNARQPEPPPAEVSPATVEAKPYSIACASCGTRFEPKPPRAICPECSTPNVDA